MFEKLGKHRAFTGAIVSVVIAAVGILLTLQLAPVIAVAVTNAKNAAADANFNNSANTILPSYSLIPIALVFGAVLAAFLGMLGRQN